eukprot:7440751-Alexandrium_andersonii.AAC.1
MPPGCGRPPRHCQSSALGRGSCCEQRCAAVFMRATFLLVLHCSIPDFPQQDVGQTGSSIVSSR